MQVVINQMENQIAEAKKLVDAVKGNVEARILYENCPLCESNNIIKSVIGDCSKQRLYNPIIPSIRMIRWDQYSFTMLMEVNTNLHMITTLRSK